MKSLPINTKNKMKSLLLILPFLSLSNLWAKDFGVITNLSGHAFLFSHGKLTKELKGGDFIQDGTEVMLADDSTLSLKDMNGHHFFLAAGSQIAVFNSIVEIKSGHLWVISSNNKNSFIIQTPNAQVRYQQGQFVTSYDASSAKTQVLVLDGEAYLANSLDPQLGVTVGPGKFSIIDPTHRNGLPRMTAQVGIASYKELRSQFNNLDDAPENFTHLMRESKPMPSRAIASVKEIPSSGGKKGKLLIIKETQQRAPASFEKMSAHTHYKKLKKRVYSKRSAPVKIYGPRPSSHHIVNKTSKASSRGRVPASVSVNSAAALINELDNNFERSLKKKSQQQKRHPDHVNSLIDDLESYNKRYKKSYTNP